MYKNLNGIAVIALDHPPVNCLSHALRERILDELDTALADPAIRGIVLTGNDKAFSAGADVGEFGKPIQLKEPILRTVITRVETSEKPVVAAIAGVALGGGLELALGCHGRVVQENARIGLPEINLGLIPGSGATQRLPRLIGIEQAHALASSGIPKSARQLANIGLFDEVVASDVIAAAIALTSEMAERRTPYPRARDRSLDVCGVQDAIKAQREKLTVRQRLQPAYAALLDALSASSLPFDEGMNRERELFLALMQTTAAQALRYQFKAERDAARLPPDLQVTARPIKCVAIIGAGTMGSGISISALDCGLNVLLLEQNDEALARGRERILQHYESRVVAGKLLSETATSNAQRLSTSTSWALLEQADLVIEAVFEDLAVKQEVFRQIDAHARAGAILATNTSYLDVDAIASVTSRPRDVLGLHFFSPAQVMKLIEVVRGSDTAADVMATGMNFAVALKKIPVMTGNAFGFIGNRIYSAYRRQCEFMLEDGAWPEDIDNALTAMGFAMGPFAVADLSGLDIAWRMRKARASTRDPRERYVTVPDQLCEAGRIGRKAGAGYYTYVDGKQSRTTDSHVRALIERASAARGIVRRELSPLEIQRRALLSMVNEAALLLAEGVASRPSDVDVVMVQGYGFPRWEGGPVFWARQQDRTAMEAELKTLAAEAGHGFVLGDLESVLMR
ncbi:3-hydroxyacyl-CoA dehydrogenase NAD-binding domain-containing protein [Pandoraea sp. XJJ-1]|uniref:3-hydroxyacyl-CoA dehydrogenase NAD-binding domain-containing protein n=1 Tax=Pandoraea sp. XJJ-1 TaxID=3002643 RepID=UPI00228118B5|nr:3-hydroxyacyl-CoA dehydrogenase NAD-binding domain-containing protein [Pandoraea sp. XJJ-1]WAL84015.1 3-hydroxyacyl-CoA dehydrogenase NAD-binding domain-containing protein [Pandoraea sp. XJJ-1]